MCELAGRLAGWLGGPSPQALLHLDSTSLPASARTCAQLAGMYAHVHSQAVQLCAWQWLLLKCLNMSRVGAETRSSVQQDKDSS